MLGILLVCLLVGVVVAYVFELFLWVFAMRELRKRGK